MFIIKSKFSTACNLEVAKGHKGLSWSVWILIGTSIGIIVFSLNDESYYNFFLFRRWTFDRIEP